MSARNSPFGLVLMFAGFGLWGIAFNALYGTLSLGCAWSWHEAALGPVSVLRLVLLSVWAVLLALHVWLLAWLWRRHSEGSARSGPEGFVRVVGLATAALGLVATLVTGGPVALLSACAP